MGDADRLQEFKDRYLTRNAYKLVDTYVLKDGEKHPFALICPGGGYAVVANFVEGKPIAKRLNELGISVFILYYRVKKKAAFPAPMDDLARAVGEILENAEAYHVDPTNYSVWGFSAGGHLAASFGTDNMGYLKYGLPKPAALVLAYPVVSMTKELGHWLSHDLLLGREATLEMEQFASVERHVTADYPPTYLWCGDADNIVSPENTRVMADALKRAGVPVAHQIYPGVDHGIGPGTGTAAQGWINEATHFWQRQS